MTDINITLLDNKVQQQIVDLILPIQQIEFNVPITLQDQPDLMDLDTNYYQGGGAFWGAWFKDELVGTIAMIATGHNSCALRKMFVKKEYRGKEAGVAQLLLNAFVEFARSRGITDIYLGTVDMLKAAHRFYEKNCFHRLTVEELPQYFPRMKADNVYYQLHLPVLQQ